MTVIALYYAFKGYHLEFGVRALFVILLAVVFASAPFLKGYFQKISGTVSVTNKIAVQTEEE